MSEPTVAEMITTMDGEQIAACDALCLSWDAVLARKFAVSRDPKRTAMKDVLQGILNAIRLHPMNFAVSCSDSPKATELTNLLEVKSETLWVPYLTALKNWQEHQAPKATPAAPTDKPTAIDAAKEAAQKAVERVKKQAQEAKAKADQLAAFLPQAVKDQQERDRQEREAAEANRARLFALIEPFALGHGTVNDNRRPINISAGGKSVGLTRFDDLLSEADRRKTLVENLRIRCEFCGEEHRITDTVEVSAKSENGETKKDCFIMRQILLPARTMDGMEPYVITQGPKKDQLKKVAVSCCRSCASLAFQITKDLEQRNPAKVWPVDLYPKLATYVAKREEEIRESNASQQDVGRRLMVPLGERTQNRTR